MSAPMPTVSLPQIRVKSERGRQLKRPLASTWSLVYGLATPSYVRGKILNSVFFAAADLFHFLKRQVAEFGVVMVGLTGDRHCHVRLLF